MQFEQGAPVWYSLKESLKNAQQQQPDAPAFIEAIVMSIIDNKRCQIKLVHKPTPSILNLLNDKLSNNQRNTASNPSLSNPKQPIGSDNIITVQNVFLEHRYDKEDSDYKNFDDLVKLPCLNEPELLKAIGERYVNDKIFSYVGPTLVVVNPYKRLESLFSEQTQELFQEKVLQNQDIYAESPHIYGIAAYCMQSIIYERSCKQAIVISGESGSGKTENTKYAMKFLTQMNAAQQQLNPLPIQSQNSVNLMRESYMNAKARAVCKSNVSIEQRILNCNPILEAFGNAKTTRNDNSSRFGKLVILHLKEDSSQPQIKQKQKRFIISSASMTNYLLEKSRIVQIASQERNYHIFYHLLKGADPSLLSSLGLTPDISAYRYLQSQCTDVESISDEGLYLEVMSSFEDLGFSEIEQKGIWSIVSAVLLLGNLDFEDLTGNGESCSISVKNKAIVDSICKKLQCTEKDLNEALTTKKRQVNSNVIQSPLSMQESIDNRDSFSKYLYERLFNWIVFRLNKSIMDLDDVDNSNTLHVLSPTQQKRMSVSKKRQIEILDIFGFEIFESNSFEQLCINFANEKLQQLYISYIFEGERNLFIQQNLEDYLTEIRYSDNKGIIDTLDRPKDPIGIFNLIDDSSSLSNNTDINLIQKMKKEHENNATHISFSQTQRMNFTIHHSTGNIDYNINNFRVKNKDEVSLILQTLASQQKMIKQILSEGTVEQNNQPNNSRVADKFLGSKFRLQMKRLMEELSSCECQFVRCIKPNASKKAGLIQSGYSLNQINCLGVLETIRVRKQGYVYRADYFRFYKDNWELYPPDFNAINADVTNMFQKITDYQALVKKLIQKHVDPKLLESNAILFGKSMIFMKENALMSINTKLLQIKEEINENVRIIQRVFRKYKLKKRLKCIKKVKEFLIRLVYRFRYLKSDLIAKLRSKRKAKELETKQNNYAKKIQKLMRSYLMKKRVKEIKAAAIIQRMYLKYKKKEYYKQKLKGVKEFIKSKFQMLKERKKFKNTQRSILFIQQWYRFTLISKQSKMCQQILNMVGSSFEIAWLKIREISAIKIQSLIRMFLTKAKNMGIVDQCRAAKNKVIYKNSILKIQRYWRYKLFQSFMRRYRNAAYKIQAYFRMKWCSKLFQIIRRNTRFIQMHVKSWLNEKYFLVEKWVKYDWDSVKRDEMLGKQNLMLLGIPYNKEQILNKQLEVLKNKYYEQHTVDNLQRAQKKMEYIQKNPTNQYELDDVTKLKLFKSKLKSQKSIVLSSARKSQQQSLQEFEDLDLGSQLKILKSSIKLGGDPDSPSNKTNRIKNIHIKLDESVDLKSQSQKQTSSRSSNIIERVVCLDESDFTIQEKIEISASSKGQVKEYYFQDLGLERDHVLYDINQESKKRQIQSQLHAKRMSVDVIKLNTIILDFDQQPVSHDIYTSQIWAKSFKDIESSLEASNSSVMKITIGETYTIVTGDNSVCYTFGDQFIAANNTSQSGSFDSGTFTPQKSMKISPNQSNIQDNNQMNTAGQIQNKYQNVNGYESAHKGLFNDTSFNPNNQYSSPYNLHNDRIPQSFQNNPLFTQISEKQLQQQQQQKQQQEQDQLQKQLSSTPNSKMSSQSNSLYNSLRKKAGLIQQQQQQQQQQNEQVSYNSLPSPYQQDQQTTPLKNNQYNQQQNHQQQQQQSQALKMSSSDRESDGSMKISPTKSKRISKQKIDNIHSIFKANNQIFLQTDQKDVYCWGDNSEFQLPFFEDQFVHNPAQLSPETSKQIVQIEQESVSHSFYYLLVDGDTLLYNTKNSYEFERIRFPTQIVSLSCGGNFTMFLTSQGLLFSSGSNSSGELGHGDRIAKKSPQVISAFKKFGEKIRQVSCGLKHTICLTNLGKIFSWGNNRFGQLGVGDKRFRSQPQLLFVKSKQVDSINSFIQVRAGLRSSIAMTVDKHLTWWGTNSCLNQQLIPVELNFSLYRNDSLSKESIPIKLMSSWSKNISVFYVIVADVTYSSSQNRNVILKALSALSAKWEDYQILPPPDKNISKFAQIKGMKQASYNQHN